MSGYKEFEGKNLDDAIHDACLFYDATREKLEIEILNDAKGGIFGLVGAKKARIRARLVHLGNVLEELSAPAKGKDAKKRPEPAASNAFEAPAKSGREAEEPARKKNIREQKKPAPRSETSSVQPETADVAEPAPAAVPARSAKETERHEKQRRPRHRDHSGHAENGGRMRNPETAVNGGDAFAENGNAFGDADMDADDLRRVPFDQLDTAELERVTREIVTKLTEPFLGNATITVSIGDDRVRVSISDVEDPGLLIGRDGQTLASVQYLATRMVSNRMKALLRVQVDAGDYRERQDERLRDLALALAEKVKAGGRPQVTRPLSSYHRRVIHVTLQDDPLIQTHSKGDGEMKRVMVARRRPEKNA